MIPYVFIIITLVCMNVRGVNGSTDGSFRRNLQQEQNDEIPPKCIDYDAIVVGGGAAGCVVAQTMAERGKCVLLLERGGEPPPNKKEDVFWLLNEANNSCIETFYTKSTSDGIVVGVGKCLGGATTYNEGVWINDKPDFLTEYGGIFTVENVTKAYEIQKFFAPEPARQQPGSPADTYVKELITALDSHPLLNIVNVTPGQPQRPDEGIIRSYSMFDQVTGKRRSADQFLDRNSPNLTISLFSKANEILFDKSTTPPTANCVQYKKGNKVTNEKVCVKKGGRIYLTAGVFHTAELLMRSGISENGKVYKNDQVGKNLSDKPGITMMSYLPKTFPYPASTIGEVATIDKRKLSSGAEIEILWEEFSFKDGYGNYPFFNFYMFPKDLDAAKNMNKLMAFCIEKKDAIRVPIVCKNLMRFIKGNCLGGITSTLTLVVTPKSRGEMKIRPNGDFHIAPGYLQHDEDIEALGSAVRTSLEVKQAVKGQSAAAKPCYDLEKCPDSCPDLFADMLSKSSKQTFQPATYFPWFLEGEAQNLTDFEIGQRLKRSIVLISAHHVVGSASLGKVVDNNLKVIGVDGLYACDASVIPVTPRINAQSVVMMIARLAGLSYN